MGGVVREGVAWARGEVVTRAGRPRFVPPDSAVVDGADGFAVRF